MAIVQGTIVDTGQSVDIELPTARVPELPAFTDIADDDEIAGWDQSDNKTKHMTVSQLRAKINGDAIPETPVLSGADMEIHIPPELVGQNRIDIPALAGYTYSLTRRGPGRLATDEFNVLSTGGFELAKEGDQFYEGDLFFAHIYELEGGNQEFPNPGSGVSLITGIKTVTLNTTLVADDLNKLINIAGATTKITLTLPDVTAIPENTIIPIETMVNNSYQSTITTQGGQNIYFRNSGQTKVYMGRGEVLWVMSSTDGWYVINAYGNFLDVGHVVMGYSNTLNTIIAQGQLVNKDSFPRLWEYAQTTGASLISDDQWNSDPMAYKGCFSTGESNGLTFRLPDLRGVHPRFNDAGRGLDLDGRTFNNNGGYQADAMKKHKHIEGTHAEPGTNFQTYGQFGTAKNGWRVDSSNAQWVQNYTSEEGDSDNETRVKNIIFTALLKT
ncbi:hypothetical protein [Chitinophaga japonensis]|uniref:Tail collar domain n=1 Tax=Chitinophaga japonensis TaxID=104662 RepID=A0A562SYA4_CHIJA|nr:hypothetical protein [Chitinophaga japonensis]TWI86292.1 hypothetical protein LX66_3546 [Chitinophaga japonensis]